MVVIKAKGALSWNRISRELFTTLRAGIADIARFFGSVHEFFNFLVKFDYVDMFRFSKFCESNIYKRFQEPDRRCLIIRHC